MILFKIVFIYLTINVAYYMLFSLASLWSAKKRSNVRVQSLKKIAVFIPAYKEDQVICHSAGMAITQNYPSHLYDTIVIADGLQQSTLDKLAELPVKVVKVEFDQSTKSKAINRAMAEFSEYDIAVVLDADNVMEPNFLIKVNEAYTAGHRVIQGHRTAKNKQNELSTLDAISEEINNSIFRKGHINLGLSSALIGSGMAFDYELLKAHMSEIHALGGFDKELEVRLLQDRVKMHYLENAFVYDEKVSENKNFDRQRTRWIAAQVKYGVRYFKTGLTQLFLNGNIDLFNKTFQFVLLPRLILIGLVSLILPIGFLLGGGHLISTASLFLLTGIALLIATPKSFLKMNTIKALLILPQMFVVMVLATMKYRKASKSFLHTTHSVK